MVRAQNPPSGPQLSTPGVNQGKFVPSCVLLVNGIKSGERESESEPTGTVPAGVPVSSPAPH